MNKQYSLKQMLIQMILASWILPLILAAVITSVVVARAIDTQTMETASSNASAAAELCAEMIDVAIGSSRRASYDGTIAKAYQAFSKSGQLVDFYFKANIYLSENYRFDDNFLFANLAFYRSDDTFSDLLQSANLYALNQSLFPRQGFTTALDAYHFYLERDRAQILERAMKLGTYIGFVTIDERVYMYRNLYLEGSRPTAALITMMNTSHWFSSIAKVPWSRRISLLISDAGITVQGDPLDVRELSRQLAFAGSKTNILRVSEFNIFKPSTYSPLNYLVGEIRSQDYLFSYAIEADNSILMREVAKYQYGILALVLLVIPFLLVSAKFFSKNIAAPIEILIKASEDIQKGNFGLRAETGGKSLEFAQLTQAFNDMSSQLRSQMEKLYMEELKLQDARIKALQSQINPHFLGNTLEIINWEARLGNNAKVSRMLESLSTMLDAAMGRSGDHTIRLSEELMYIDAYLYIISERFGKRLKIIKEVDESLLDCHVPRLILQPVMENAIEHGAAVKQKGEIILRVYSREGMLLLEVENDSPLSSQDEAKIKRLLSASQVAGGERLGSTRLGIKNTNERLKMIFGDESGLAVTGTPSGSTLSRISIQLSELSNRKQGIANSAIQNEGAKL
ncbi:MAG: sensor histidine kinase [Clostridiales bacterium]|nr:sensor histidine kinase [Clostridiales bacterium]MDR2750243.1 sensor histidine kinase [Clostridiales bacterium]